MKLKKALLTTPTGHVKNTSLNMLAQSWDSVIGHMVHNETPNKIAYIKDITESTKWEHDTEKYIGIYPTPKWKALLAAKYFDEIIELIKKMHSDT